MLQEDAEEIAAEFEKAYPNNRLVDVLSLDYIFRYASKDSLRRSQYIRKLPYIPTCLIMNSHMRRKTGMALL